MKVIFKYLKIIIFTISIFILFYILKNSFNSKEFTNLIFKSEKKYLILCLLIVITEVIFKSIRLKEISKPFDINYSLFDFIKIQTISISFSIITPGRIGEFTKIYLLNDKYKDKLLISTFICIFERFFDIFILCFFSLVLSLFVLNNSHITSLIIISFLLMILSVYLLINIKKFEKLLKKTLPYNLYKIIEVFILNKDKLISKIPITILITSIVWSINSFVQLLVLYSLNFQQSLNYLLLIIGINAVVSIMSILTILPLGIGTMDVSALFLYKNILKLKTETILFLLNVSRFLSIISLLILFIPFIIFQPNLINLLKNKNSG